MYILKTAARKLVIFLIFGSVAVCAFATLGEGKIGRERPRKTSLLSNKIASIPGTFSLKSGYTFRGNQVIDFNKQPSFVSLSTVVTYQTGNTTYILPLRKKVILNDKITFNPNEATRSSY